jgi:hypothetical protein
MQPSRTPAARRRPASRLFGESGLTLLEGYRLTR